MKNTLNRNQNLDYFKNKEWKNKINFTKTKIASKIEKILKIKYNFHIPEWNIDLKREILLANIFWLTEEQKIKLSKDYSENLTMNDVLEHLEKFTKIYKLFFKWWKIL